MRGQYLQSPDINDFYNGVTILYLTNIKFNLYVMTLSYLDAAAKHSLLLRETFVDVIGH
jgi:hypothetical protein